MRVHDTFTKAELAAWQCLAEERMLGVSANDLTQKRVIKALRVIQAKAYGSNIDTSQFSLAYSGTYHQFARVLRLAQEGLYITRYPTQRKVAIGKGDGNNWVTYTCTLHKRWAVRPKHSELKHVVGFSVYDVRRPKTSITVSASLLEVRKSKKDKRTVAPAVVIRNTVYDTVLTEVWVLRGHNMEVTRGTCFSKTPPICESFIRAVIDALELNQVSMCWSDKV